MAEPPTRSEKGPFGTSLDLVLLTLAAGTADAAGFLGLGKIFTANMTGNIVLLGLSLSQARHQDATRGLCALLLFAAGVCAGGWLCSRVGDKPRMPSVTLVLGVETALLFLFAALWGFSSSAPTPALSYGLIALLGSSMGMQSAAVNRLGVASIVTTVVTGTLTGLLTGLMQAATRPSSEKPSKKKPFGLQAIVVAAYGIAAAISGLLVLHARAYAGLLPGLLILVVVLMRLGRRD
jgi:uncharacterized membrane protein YoaK (UPF0700 family)